MNLYLNNLSKTYSNGVKALINVSMTISNGMFGLLGPNGAGKSTLMRTIATLQEPDTGEARLGDIDLLKNPIELRKILGYLPPSFGVYPKMNAYDLLHYMGQLKGISNKRERDDIVASALELTNLYDVRFKEVAGYSGGMKQRFGIAQLLLNKNDEYELLNSDFLDDVNSADIDLKSKTNSSYKVYFDKKTLKIGVKHWITDFYSCQKIESSNFAKKKLIDIFVNQNEYVKKDFAYREKNPSLFTNNIELLAN